MSDGKLTQEGLDGYRHMATMPVANSGAIRMLLAHIAALEQERDAAIADNAALVAELRTAHLYINALAMGSPRFESDAELALRDQLTDVIFRPHPGAALLEEHRKALVRARNEGREDVAKACLAKRDSIMRGVKPGTRRGGLEEAASIARSMKELESA